jgi:hypothetical protein
VGALVGGYYKSTLGLQAVFGLVAILIAIGAASLFLGYRVFLRNDLRRAEDIRRQSVPSAAPVTETAH